MGEPAFKIDPDRRYTYADYLTWPDEFRCELIEGKVYMMSPAPSVTHQDAVGEVFRQLANQLKGASCRPLIAPLDVRLPRLGRRNDSDETVVQPDVMVVCDPAKFDARGVKGPPDWVIEVISPKTASRDQILKRRMYEAAGVREYWIVHPIDRVLTVYVLHDGAYGAPELFELTGRTASSILPEVVVDWDALPPAPRDDAGDA
ncbi:MAG: Uma2 family endonuclease [Halothiobacillaceae bacterium]|nr:MAG: Uma2 family endonuclease [Halothiobacillaceae bacterium]